MSINSNKIWQIMPKISEEDVKNNPEFSPVISQLLFNRGLTEKNEIEKFLNAAYGGDEFDPFVFNQMNEAVDKIIKHIKEGNKIVVYGDYDADGVTSAAVLIETLRVLKANVDVYIPDRVTEGYGLNKNALDEVLKMEAKLIITVDGGIRNKTEVAYAKELGVDVIITDHHIPPEDKKDLPNCLIINPSVIGEKYPFKFLAGVGVAFKLSKAIISRTKLDENDKLRLEERVMDLVAIGTIADCVSVLGENRTLIKKGLEILNQRRRKGVDVLINASAINSNKPIDSWNIGFQIAPRLNAAGRMDHANTAFELLITKDEEEAASIALRLNERNIDRQKITEDIVNEVLAQINPDDKIIIGICPEDFENESWKEGVIGLVAGKISERYYRPTLVITRTNEGLKGSGRSIEEFNIVKALEESSEFLQKYGGHPAACGFSLSPERLDDFVKKIKLIAADKLKDADLRPKLKIEMEADLNILDENFLVDVDKFAPFGQNNERPRFVSFGCLLLDKITMGVNNQHIKLRIKSGNSGIFNAIGFGQAASLNDLKIGDRIDIVYYPEINEFNGRRDIQLKIIDIKKCNSI